MHFRAQRSLSEILRLPFSLGVSQTLQTVMQTEQALVGQEAGRKRMLMSQTQEQWPFRPNVESYCGLRDEEGVSLVHEVKNAGYRCQDFGPAETLAPQPCETCMHNAPARGPSQDHADVMDAISPANNYYNPDVGSSQVKNNLQTVMSVAEARQTEEMLAALHGGGMLPQPPRYYAHCRKYSTPGRYVVSRTRNPDGRCPGWAGSGAHPPPALPRPSGALPAPPSAARPIPPPATAPPRSGGGATAPPERPRSVLFQTLAERLIEELWKK